ncbi:glutamine-synthetase adenylyltransferase [Cognatishimia sp. 1_MG-2023]|uniref:[protein-PII] uridylyltransferase family protein n=1 Tax=Cognatishimia sp. 1_MG-2023 TaxID=3062642 RepID=UPI0026E15370|nr:glutamine-synthetase adenylyltransferase [Cognatishimia sp. 1_MG-2023]MDO6727390.1 glutamine-synthetase adenylyltransferase [Cognatishimia sp. 1_MG-2023]
MTFTQRITRLPRPFDPDRGQDALDAVPSLSGDLGKLVLGAGGSSFYLKQLIEKEKDWLPPALDAPEEAIVTLFKELRAEPVDQLPAALRQGKRRVALLTALADVAGVWPLETVTGALTDFADLATDLAVKAMVGKEIARGKLPGMTEDDISDAGGMVCLAMGKMGAHELNYSSDIDLICLFDETRYDSADFYDARSSLVRATRRAMSMLNDLTGDGYVFRTDLRLRPDPSVTPVCLAMEAAERYYESLGRTWERAAYIKARPAAGDVQAGERFLKALRPFVWRKHLDFAAIQDAHDMRLRIREHKGLGGKLSLPGHNIKLGRGGIREIEFFTQTRQLIAGGRDRELRGRETVASLALLAEKGWVPTEAAEKLTGHYRAHRELEHRIQMINDAQTHDFPKSDEGMQRIACLMGRDLAELRADVTERLNEVHALTEDFFAPDAVQPIEQTYEFDNEILKRWKTYPALRSSRANEIFDRLRPELLGRLAKTARPSEALVALDGFLAGLPAGVQVFSLFDANPQLVDLLIDIVGTSPALAKYLSRNSAVLDGVIGGAFFADWPAVDALRAELTVQLAAEPDYERKLDLTRRWTKEWHFRVGVHHLRGVISAEEAGVQYAELAEAVLSALWPEVAQVFAEKHGPMPGRGAMVLAMGSLGAGQLNAGSDLDLIVIYDAAGVEMSDGRRPLGARQYYSRLTQAMVTAVTAPMAEGRLYEVDMRLRPSGTKGPVATSLASFTDYQENSAWTWEHLALTRARPVAGDAGLMDAVERFRQSLLARDSDEGKTRKDVAEMRERIASAKSPNGVWDAKIGAGRMQDIELTAQAAGLLAGTSKRDIYALLEAGAALGWFAVSETEALRTAYQRYHGLQVASRLLGEQTIDPATIGVGGQEFLLREMGAETFSDLETLLAKTAAEAAQVIETALARPVKGHSDD